MSSRRSPLIGCAPTCQSSGSSAMGSGSSMNACRRRRKSASSTPIKWEPTAGCCSMHSGLLLPQTGCKHFPLSPHCAPFGSSSLKRGNKEDNGDESQPCQRLRSSTLPMTLTRARAAKRTTLWVGYKVHFTQTCDEDAPHLITHVETSQAPITDEHSLSAIHADLAERELLPDQHLVDAGYVTIDNLVQSQSGYGVDEGPPYPQNALVSGGDWLRPHALLHQLES